MRFAGVLFILLLVSCKKPVDRACVKSHGKEAIKEIGVSAFNRVFLPEKINYVLVQDTVEKVVLSGGENMLNFIRIEVVDGRLELYNENKCAFLRNFKQKVTAEIHFKELINIHYEGTEELKNKGLLELGWLTLLIRDGAGPVKLNMNAAAVFATISHGWGDFTFTGTVGHANLNVRSNGYCDTYGLTITDSITVVSSTPGSVKINAHNAGLKAEINGSGDIFYKGTTLGEPMLYRYGSGELIHQ